MFSYYLLAFWYGGRILPRCLLQFALALICIGVVTYSYLWYGHVLPQHLLQFTIAYLCISVIALIALIIITTILLCFTLLLLSLLFRTSSRKHRLS